MQKKVCIIMFVFFMVSYNSLLAYDGKVHMEINEEASSPSNSNLHDALMNQLGFENGIQGKLKRNNTEKRVLEWIAYGGEAEDFGRYGENDKKSTRAYNHFHDPLKTWNSAGLNNPINLLYWELYGRWPLSSIIWGLDSEVQNQPVYTITFGNWSWPEARVYYYNALTGLTKEERENNYADCFRALGQVMHLLQDVSVPAHTRNDLHIFPLKKDPSTGEPIGRWTYETYTLRNRDSLNYSPLYPSEILLNDPQPESEYSYLAPISGLFDRNIYNEGSPIPASNAAIGLAEYSNANFFSQDTIWTYQHPSLDDTNYATIDWLNPTSVIAEDGKTDNRIHIKKTAGEPINHLAAADYWSYEYLSDINMIESPFILDNKCWEDYAEKLVPRAVGYSAALLDYFFRGKLEVSALPVFVENAIYGMRLKIKNVTPTEEAMTMSDEDRLVLVCRYTPDGANPDGSEDKFVMANAYSCIDGDCDADGNLDGIQYGDEATINFYFPEEEEDRIGMQIFKSAEESVKCMLWEN